MNAVGILEGQVALITGGGRGIGRAIARAFASAGASVVLTARTEAEIAKAVAAEIRGVRRSRHRLVVGGCLASEAGLREERCAAARECFRRACDILVNNAWSSRAGRA